MFVLQGRSNNDDSLIAELNQSHCDDMTSGQGALSVFRTVDHYSEPIAIGIYDVSKLVHDVPMLISLNTGPAQPTSWRDLLPCLKCHCMTQRIWRPYAAPPASDGCSTLRQHQEHPCLPSS
jgi:hypothetical protein